MALFIFIGLFLAILLVLNIWHWTRRSRMTPGERRREDQDLRTPGDW